MGHKMQQFLLKSSCIFQVACVPHVIHRADCRSAMNARSKSATQRAMNNLWAQRNAHNAQSFFCQLSAGAVPVHLLCVSTFRSESRQLRAWSESMRRSPWYARHWSGGRGLALHLPCQHQDLHGDKNRQHQHQCMPVRVRFTKKLQLRSIFPASLNHIQTK